MKRRTGKTNPPAAEPSALERRTRTDLALEEQELFLREAGSAAHVPGVELSRSHRRGIETTVLRVLDEQGAKELRKPVGTYITLELGGAEEAVGSTLHRLIRTLAGELAALMRLKADREVLVVGLGNDRVSYDALGPMTLRRLMVTKHLTKTAPELRKVSALEPGVLAKTGIESARIIRAVVEKTKPAAVLAIDALAARVPERLCQTVQLTDTGLTPGSGVGRRSAALTREQLGVPVFAIGVPTVIDAANLPIRGQELVLTPRTVHEKVERLSRLIAGGVNLALHAGLTLEQIAHYVELG